jgi:hypothetical protein
LNNVLLHKFYGGEYIDQDAKNSIVSNLQESTRFGGDVLNGLTYLYKTDSGKVFDGLQVSFGTYTHVDGITNDQLVGLALNGNKAYIGETINSSHSNFLLLNYQELSISFIKKMKRTGRFGVGVSIYNGQNFNLIDLNEFTLTTHEDGRSVDLSVNVNSLISDTSQGNFGESTGLGAGLNFFVSEKINLFNGSENGRFTAEISDLGFIFWNDNVVEEKIDTTHLGFQGFEIDNIFNLDDNSNNTNADSMFVVSKGDKSGVRTILPGNLLITIDQVFGKHSLGLRFSQRIVANHLAHVGFNYGYLIGNKFKPYLNLGYGGYGKFNMGAGIQLDLGSFALYASTLNLEGLLMKEYSGGNSAFIGIKGRF